MNANEAEEALGDAGVGRSGPDGHSDGAAQVPRKERERTMHRDGILDAARRLLERKSYDEITVQEIAAESEFSVGYIYKVFESKEDVYVALVRATGDDLIHLMESELSGGGKFEERFSTLVGRVLIWLDANPAFTAHHIHEIHTLVRSLPRLAEAHAEREEILQQKILRFLESGIEAGAIEGDIEVMAVTIRALVWGFIGEDLLHGNKKGNWSQYAPVVVRVFMRAFAPEGGSI